MRYVKFILLINFPQNRAYYCYFQSSFISVNVIGVFNSDELFLYTAHMLLSTVYTTNMTNNFRNGIWLELDGVWTKAIAVSGELFLLEEQQVVNR